MTDIRAVILDVDGTLINSNDAHAHSWIDAMAEAGYTVPFEKVRPLIGMGGDKVLPETIGVEKSSEEGQRISKRRDEIFEQRYLSHVRPFPQAKELLKRIRECGLKVAIASSSSPKQLKALLSLVDGSTLVQEETSSKDAQNSKPAPDVMEVTLQRVGDPPNQCIMIGDTAFDIESAKKVGVETIAFRSGGWSDKDLAGAIAIYDGPADLLEHFQSSPLAC